MILVEYLPSIVVEISFCVRLAFGYVDDLFFLIFNLRTFLLDLYYTLLLRPGYIWVDCLPCWDLIIRCSLTQDTKGRFDSGHWSFACLICPRIQGPFVVGYPMGSGHGWLGRYSQMEPWPGSPNPPVGTGERFIQTEHLN